MGKGTIINEVGNGNYTVRIETHKPRVTQEIADLDEELDIMEERVYELIDAVTEEQLNVATALQNQEIAISEGIGGAIQDVEAAVLREVMKTVTVTTALPNQEIVIPGVPNQEIVIPGGIGLTAQKILRDVIKDAEDALRKASKTVINEQLPPLRDCRRLP